MSANNNDDQDVLKNALRDNLSPNGVVAILAYLQAASLYQPTTEEGQQSMRELEWFADTLRELVPVEERNRLIDELGL